MNSKKRKKEITLDDIKTASLRLKNFKGYKEDLCTRLNEAAQSTESLKNMHFNAYKINNIKSGVITNQIIRLLYIKIASALADEYSAQVEEALRKTK